MFKNSKIGYQIKGIKGVKDKNAIVYIDNIINKIYNANELPMYRDYDKINEFMSIHYSTDDLLLKKQSKTDANKIKEILPIGTLSGYQEYGHDNQTIEYNGIIQIDLDFKFKGGDITAKDVKELLKSLDYIIFAAISPSGFGIKGAVQTNNRNKEHHLDISESVHNKIIEDINRLDLKEFCDGRLAVSQPCYIPHDKYVYYNEEAVIFECDSMLFTNINNNTNTIPVNVKKGTYVVKDSQLDKCLEIAYRHALKKGEIGKYNFRTSYISVTSQFGIQLQDAINYLLFQDASSVTQNRLTEYESIFDSFKDQFGTKKYNDITLYEPSVSAVFDLNGLYLSDYIKNNNIDFPNKYILQSGTGTGKTKAIFDTVTDKKIIIICPSRSLVEQVAQKYKTSKYFGGSKQTEGNIAVTYHSFKKLCNEDGFNPKDYIIFIDEAHNFTSSANNSFMLDVLQECEDSLGMFEKTIYLTATPLFNSSPLLRNLPIYKFTSKDKINKTLNHIYYNDDLWGSVLRQCEINKENNILSVIYYNNTKDKKGFGKLKKILKHYNVAVLNSKQKNETDFKRIVVDGVVDSNIDVIICTTVIKEGTCIEEHTPNINVIVIGIFHPIDCIQMGARFRNAESLTISYITKNNEGDIEDEDFGFYDYNKTYNDIYKSALDVVGAFNEINRNNSKTLEMYKGLQKCPYYKIDKDSGLYTPCQLEISNKLFEIEKSKLYFNYDETVKYYKRYGYTVNNDITTDGVIDDLTKQEIKENIAAIEELETNCLERVLNKLRHESYSTNQNKIEITYNRTEKRIRQNYDMIYQYFQDSAIIEDLLRRFNDNFNKLFTIIKLRDMFLDKNPNNINSDVYKYFAAIKKTSENIREMNTEDFVNICNTFGFEYIKGYKKQTPQSCMLFANAIWDIKVQQKQVNGKRCRGFVILKDNSDADKILKDYTTIKSDFKQISLEELLKGM